MAIITSILRVLALTLVTISVTNLKAAQLNLNQLSPKKLSTSQLTPTAPALNQKMMDLYKAAKFLPRILDNNTIDYKKSAYETPNKVSGPSSGGGGNLCAQGIVKLTKNILYHDFNQSPLTKIQVQMLKNVIPNTLFVHGENLPKIEGEEKNGINFPSLKIIVLDNLSCQTLIEGGEAAYSFLLHEYKGLAGIDDRDYNSSLESTKSLIDEATAFDGNKPIFDTVIKNVTICAASCQNEILGHLGHDRAFIGTIYFAPATNENLSNKNLCMSESKEAPIYSDRRSDLSSNSCAEALADKYYGKVVDLYPYVSEDLKDDGAGGGFKINVVKKGSK